MAEGKTIFQRIAANMPTTIQPRFVRQAKQWFRDQAEQIHRVNQRTLFRNANHTIVTDINYDCIGSMFFYEYDPKLKEKLPYYDMFPLVFPIEIYNDGWLGLNLHYLPPALRARLMDALYSITLKEKGGKQQVQASYEILKATRRFRYFKPCVKRYLNNHVRSQIIFIEPKDWDMALLLPLQRFAKQSEDYVWKESQEKVG